MLEEAIQKYLSRNNFKEIAPKAILFDMDGVIFDSMPHHAIAWVKAMHESGLPFTEEQAYMNEGQPGADTVNGVFAEFYGRESTLEERTRVYNLKGRYFSELGTPQKMPYIEDILNIVKTEALDIYIVTGSGHPQLLQSLNTHFPGFFSKEKVISAFDVRRGKPFPDPYIEALKRANAQPWQAVVIENAPLGVRASSAAQIFTVGVNTGPLDKNILLENGADVVFNSMKELLEQWHSLNFLNKIN